VLDVLERAYALTAYRARDYECAIERTRAALEAGVEMPRFEDIPAPESVSEQVVDLPTAPASQDALARLLASGLGGAGAQKKRR
jgi:hypothetical protein